MYVCYVCVYVRYVFLRRYLCLSSRSFAGFVGSVMFSTKIYILYEMLLGFT
jgi:hypothetical protein